MLIRQIIYSNKRLLILKTKPNNLHRNKTTSTAEYCLDSIKRYDYENFVCTLLLKNSARSCAFAVRGFNVEIARVGEQVSEQNIGLMRFKFWEDAINACYTQDISKVPQHPIALELFKVIRRSKLTKRHFMSLISSRQEKLAVNSFTNLEDLEKYSEKSVSSIYYLILEGSGVTNIHADHAASHLGKAQGIVQQLRSTVMARKLNIIPLPQDVLIKHKVSHEELLRGTPSKRLNDCGFEIASRAHQHLVKARSLLKDVPVEARATLLPAVSVSNYLDRLQKVDYELFHPYVQQKSWLWLPNLWLTRFQNKY